MSVSEDPEDLTAAEIDGLFWHVNSPALVSMAIDTDGLPVRIVAPDPVAFAVHKLWLSRRPDRNPAKKHRDARQAEIVARIVSEHLPHLAFDPEKLRQFPREVVEDAAHMFEQQQQKSTFDW